MIEKGRHLNIDRELRYCEYCVTHDLYTIEREIHVLLFCPLYADIRQTYFTATWLSSVICDQLFVTILTDTNHKNSFTLAKFLYAAFEKRQSFMK